MINAWTHLSQYQLNNENSFLAVCLINHRTLEFLGFLFCVSFFLEFANAIISLLLFMNRPNDFDISISTNQLSWTNRDRMAYYYYYFFPFFERMNVSFLTCLCVCWGLLFFYWFLFIVVVVFLSRYDRTINEQVLFFAESKGKNNERIWPWIWIMFIWKNIIISSSAFLLL